MAESTTRRRQARGELRIAQLLDAAAVVFAETGYEAATTNAIAARAGVSPGTLYQFFANKAAIAAALADRYADELEAAGERLADEPQRPVEDLLADSIDAMVAANLAQPAVGALLTAAVPSAGPPVAAQPLAAAQPTTAPQAPAAPQTPAGEGAGAPVHRLHAVVAAQLDALLAERAPTLAAADRARCVQVSIQIYKAMLPVIAAAGPADQALLVTELKQVMIRYLGPYLGR
jgi:AcrR family transcriptional regulator